MTIAGKVKQEADAPLRKVSVELTEAILLAIKEGVPLWNSKDYAGCTARYMLVAARFTEEDPRIATALGLCKDAPVNGSMHSQGWILRRAFNTIMGKPRRIRNSRKTNANTPINTPTSVRQSRRKRKPPSVLSYSFLGETGGYETSAPRLKRLSANRKRISTRNQSQTKSAAAVRQSARKRKSPSVLSYSILGETGCGYGARGIHTEAVKGGSISVTRKDVASRVPSVRHSFRAIRTPRAIPMASSPRTRSSRCSGVKRKKCEPRKSRSRPDSSESDIKYAFSIGDCVEARRKAGKNRYSHTFHLGFITDRSRNNERQRGDGRPRRSEKPRYVIKFVDSTESETLEQEQNQITLIRRPLTRHSLRPKTMVKTMATRRRRSERSQSRTHQSEGTAAKRRLSSEPSPCRNSHSEAKTESKSASPTTETNPRKPAKKDKEKKPVANVGRVSCTTPQQSPQLKAAEDLSDLVAAHVCAFEQQIDFFRTHIHLNATVRRQIQTLTSLVTNAKACLASLGMSRKCRRKLPTSLAPEKAKPEPIRKCGAVTRSITRRASTTSSSAWSAAEVEPEPEHKVQDCDEHRDDEHSYVDTEENDFVFEDDFSEKICEGEDLLSGFERPLVMLGDDMDDIHFDSQQEEQMVHMDQDAHALSITMKEPGVELLDDDQQIDYSEALVAVPVEQVDCVTDMVSVSATDMASVAGMADVTEVTDVTSISVADMAGVADVASVSCTEPPLVIADQPQATTVPACGVEIECDLVSTEHDTTDADVARDALACFGEDLPGGVAVLGEPLIVAEALACDVKAGQTVVAVEDKLAGPDS